MLSAAAKTGVSNDVECREDDTWTRHRKLWLWLIVIAGAGLRLIAIGSKSFWIDEIASVAIARRAAPVFWHFLWHDEGNMAAYYVLLRPWLRFGYGEGTVRLLSVVPGVLAIPLMYAVARKLFGTRTALLASLFLTLNACAISVSQEARAYSFVVLAVLLSTYLFLRVVEERSYGVALGYAIVAGLTCYFHYFGVLVPAAHYVAVFGVPQRRRPWKSLIVAVIVMLVIASPMLWLMHAQDTGHISWVGSPSLLELYHLGAFLAADSGKVVGAALLALDLVLVGFFAGGLRRAWRDDEQRWKWVLVASSVATPLVLTLLVSVVRPAFYHRFLIICLPGWVLMTALGAQQIRRAPWRQAAISAVCALSLVSSVIVYRRVNEDWRAAVQYLIAHAHADDRVLYYQAVGEFAGENYRDWLPGGQAARPKSIAVMQPSGDWEQQIEGARQLWLVLYRAKATDPDAATIVQTLRQQGFAIKDVQGYRGVTVMQFDATGR